MSGSGSLSDIELDADINNSRQQCDAELRIDHLLHDQKIMVLPMVVIRQVFYEMIDG